MELTMRQSHPLFVGEVSGVDVGRPLDAATVTTLNMHRGRSFDETRVRDLRRVTTRDVASTLDQVA